MLFRSALVRKSATDSVFQAEGQTDMAPSKWRFVCARGSDSNQDGIGYFDIVAGSAGVVKPQPSPASPPRKLAVNDPLVPAVIVPGRSATSAVGWEGASLDTS